MDQLDQSVAGGVPGLSDEACRFLHRFGAHFVTTYVDKCPQTFSFMCKKLYLQLLDKEFVVQASHAAAASVYRGDLRSQDRVIAFLQDRARRVGAFVSFFYLKTTTSITICVLPANLTRAKYF